MNHISRKIMSDKLNRILVAADCSNFEYVCINSALKYWKDKYSEEYSFTLKPAEETDQDNLPNLLNSDTFRRVLSKNVQMKLEGLIWIVKNNHPSEVSMSDGMDFIFTRDDRLHNNFRKLKYPEYKAQRKLMKRQFDVFSAMEYIHDVIFKELDIEKLGFKIIGVKDCESDDIIAVMMNRFKNYFCRILISSDRDFLQLEDVYQYDNFGNEIICGFKHGGQFIEMTPKNYLLWKILKGDTADNIKNVLPRCGDVTAYKLLQDKDKLKKMLMENKEAAKNYSLNKYLIDFNSIPQDVSDRIYEELKKILGGSERVTEKPDFDIDSCMIM